MGDREMGMLLGLITGLVAGGIIIWLLFRKRVLDFTFDERQERARGRAFQYAFFTLTASLLVYGASEMAVGRWCDAMAGCCLCIAVSILVFAVNCILKDAYLSLREKPRQVMTLFVLLTALNLGFGVISLLKGELVEDGVLTFRVTNLAVGTATLVILAVYVANVLLRRQEETE